jgi:selenide, water dikinase
LISESQFTTANDYHNLRYNGLMLETKPFRLTESVKAAGCASKLSPATLDKVLGRLPRQHDPNVLVGFDHADDAGVYRITPDQALVQTVDFFTPVVDDPYTFGQIAATNALSDVYAMGGKPLTSLALVCFPEKADLEILERILAGGLSKMIEAGCTVIGGHSIRDEETKFGYSVTGIIDPKKVLANQGAKPGDVLLFTKALGTGVISTALKKGKADQNWIDAAIRSMTTLNKRAAEIITGVGTTTAYVGTAAPGRPAKQSEASVNREGHGFSRADPATNQERASAPAVATTGGFSVHALTDVTGFGLIGHARELALASNVSLTIQASRVPLLDGALECVRAGHIPGGLKNNRDFAECLVAYDDQVPEDRRTILFDPQTAGGLLISVAKEDAARLAQALHDAGVPAAEIGEVHEHAKPIIRVEK